MLRLVIGSSPLARGTRAAARADSRGVRLIPARAGNTAWLRMRTVSTSAHPRSRGEHSVQHVPYLESCGSSPLARGTPGRRVRDKVQRRLIPARAGNTMPVTYRSVSPAAHPRSRGEHASTSTTGANDCGSSPLARGTQAPHFQPKRSRRLIPARAGNTVSPPAHPTADAAHPRSRGEHGSRTLLPGPRRGSSPLARGTLHRASSRASSHRLIPARAGNTRRTTFDSPRPPAHPRSRGEHFLPWDAVQAPAGSSPLARGTRRQVLLQISLERLIPARAGNTVGRCFSRLRLTAHPRSRGEHVGGVF